MILWTVTRLTPSLTVAESLTFTIRVGTPGVGVPPGGTTGQVLGKVSDTNYDTDWIDQGGGGGAPTNATYVTLSTNSTLTAERVLTPGSGITITDGGAVIARYGLASAADLTPALVALNELLALDLTTPLSRFALVT